MTDIQTAESDLVFVGDDGEPFTTSLVIAEHTGHAHQNVRELVEDNAADFEEFGVLRFQTGKPSGSENRGGRPTKYARLNEPQAARLVTYLRNSPVVKDPTNSLVPTAHTVGFVISGGNMSLPNLLPVEELSPIFKSSENYVRARLRERDWPGVKIAGLVHD